MSACNTTTRNKHSGINSNSAGGQYSHSRSSSSIDITKEELSRISEALKKEEFRKLFLDYCEEIQDPENRKRYEDEIKQLEAERGVDVRFINPEPGFVIKTSADGLLKCFINIAKSPEVAKPTNEVSVNQDNGERGISWSLPMAQAPPRDDLDANNKRCRVYDVVFHPDALHLARRNSEFRKCVIDTALDAVEREYKVKLDRANLKFPKLDYKGVARPTVIRKLAKDAPAETKEPHPLDHIYPARPTTDSENPETIPLKDKIPPKPEFATPKYVIKHRRGIDLTEYTEELDSKLNVTVPRELVVEIQLPLLPTAAECQLDVTEHSIYLLSERAGAKYRLKLELPHIVNDKEGAARFDTDTRRLSITLPVIQPSMERQRNMHNTLLHLNREDSGVDSDLREESTTENSPSESPVQEIEQSFAAVVDPKLETVEELQQSDNDDSQTVLPQLLEVTSETFLKVDVPYKFPEKLDCNVLSDIMSLVLHVRNVQADSIIKLQLAQSVHLHFTSIGSGYYPTYYAFYIQLPTDCELEIDSTDAEAWENNVVLNLKLNGSSEQLETYLAGIDSKDLKSFNIRNQVKSLQNARKPDKLNSIMNGPVVPSLEVAVDRPKDAAGGDTIEIAIKPKSGEQISSIAVSNNTNIEDEETKAGGDAQTAQKKTNRKQKKRQKKQRSLSESACDDIKNAIEQLKVEQENIATSKQLQSPTLPQTANDDNDVALNNATPTAAIQTPRKQRSYSECRDNVARSEDSSTTSLPYKGILKHYSRYGHQIRSLTSDSCSSSIEDCSSYSSPIDSKMGVASSADYPSMRYSKSFSDIPEENAGDHGLSESCKKTVRFNDIIQKQTFRLDSSILGQRKKNQKRRDRKQRALQRRLSEGDSADYDEDHKPIVIKRDDQRSKTENNDNNVYNGDGDGSKQTPSECIAIKKCPMRSENGKALKGKKKRQSSNTALYSRQESESSDMDGNKSAMMFEIDME